MVTAIIEIWPSLQPASARSSSLHDISMSLFVPNPKGRFVFAGTIRPLCAEIALPNFMVRVRGTFFLATCRSLETSDELDAAAIEIIKPHPFSNSLTESHRNLCQPFGRRERKTPRMEEHRFNTRPRKTAFFPPRFLFPLYLSHTLFSW